MGGVTAVSFSQRIELGESDAAAQAMTTEMRARLVGMLVIARYPSKCWRVQLLEAGWTFSKVRRDRGNAPSFSC